MRKHDLVIGLVGFIGHVCACVPAKERDDDAPPATHFSGAEWWLDDAGHVMSTTMVLVERSAGSLEGRVLREVPVGPDEAKTVLLAGTSKGGVLRIVELRAAGKRVIELTPLGTQDFDERARALDAGPAID